MTSSWLVVTTMTLAAPLPAEVGRLPSGPAPRVYAVRPDGQGDIWLEGRSAFQGIRKRLSEYDGHLSTAAGRPLTVEEAARLLRSGGTLLISSDGNAVDPAWLKAVVPETVVLRTKDFAEDAVSLSYGRLPLPETPAPRLVLLVPDPDGTVRVPAPLPGCTVRPGSAHIGGGELRNGVVLGGGLRYGAVIEGVQVLNVVDFANYFARKTLPEGLTRLPLAEVRFTASDVSGRAVSRADALTRLKAGGLVLIMPADQLPDPLYLKGFRSDVLVLGSPSWNFFRPDVQELPPPTDRPPVRPFIRRPGRLPPPAAGPPPAEKKP